MRRTWRSVLPLVILAVVVGYLYQRSRATSAPPPDARVTTPAARTSGKSLPAFLPPEARHTLALIARGGPFPHPQDGEVFGNYEHRLPGEPRGY